MLRNTLLLRFSLSESQVPSAATISWRLSQQVNAISSQTYIRSELSLIAYFFPGSAISWDGHFNVQIENEVFSTVLDLLLNCACFVYIGAWLPFEAFNSPVLGITPWRLIVLFIAVLFLRRIPPLLVLYKWVPEITNWREALFSGHFGKCTRAEFEFSET